MMELFFWGGLLLLYSGIIACMFLPGPLGCAVAAIGLASCVLSYFL